MSQCVPRVVHTGASTSLGLDQGLDRLFSIPQRDHSVISWSAYVRRYIFGKCFIGIDRRSIEWAHPRLGAVSEAYDNEQCRVRCVSEAICCCNNARHN